MIFTGLKRKSNQIFFNKKLSEFNSIGQAIHPLKTKDILVVCDENSQTKVNTKQLKSIFPSANIQLLIYSKKKTKNTIENVISEQDFGWYGSVNNHSIKEILTKPVDLLICYSIIESVYIDILCLLANSSFRVGNKYSNHSIFKLKIECDMNNVDVFNSEVEKYLSILNKK